MNLCDILQEERILIDMQSSAKEEAIHELVRAAVHAGIELDFDETVAAFMERENLGSTGIGLGVALPHIRIESVDQCMILFGKSQGGVDFAAIDNKPVHLFFMIFGPAKQERQENYLKLMATISKMMRKQEIREEIMGITTPAQALGFFQRQPD